MDLMIIIMYGSYNTIRAKFILSKLIIKMKRTNTSDFKDGSMVSDFISTTQNMFDNAFTSIQ